MRPPLAPAQSPPPRFALRLRLPGAATAQTSPGAPGAPGKTPPRLPASPQRPPTSPPSVAHCRSDASAPAVARRSPPFPLLLSSPIFTSLHHLSLHVKVERILSKKRLEHVKWICSR